MHNGDRPKGERSNPPAARNQEGNIRYCRSLNANSPVEESKKINGRREPLLLRSYPMQRLAAMHAANQAFRWR